MDKDNVNTHSEVLCCEIHNLCNNFSATGHYHKESPAYLRHKEMHPHLAYALGRSPRAVNIYIRQGDIWKSLCLFLFTYITHLTFAWKMYYLRLSHTTEREYFSKMVYNF